MNSQFYLSFTKIFVVASWINASLSLVATILFMNDTTSIFIVVLSIAMCLVCAVCACIFYFIYRRVSNREDLEIIQEIDKQLRGNKDE